MRFDKIPLTKTLQSQLKMEYLFTINNYTTNNMAHLTGINVVSSVIKSFDMEITKENIMSFNNEWINSSDYNAEGPFISNGSRNDLLLLMTQMICADACIIGGNTIRDNPKYSFNPFEFKINGIDTYNIIQDQRELLKNEELIYRDQPAIILITTGDYNDNNGMDILDCNVFKHICPVYNKQHEIFIVTTQNGVDNIKSRWHKYSHLKSRDIDPCFIILPNEVNNPNRMDFTNFNSILFNEPYNMKYVEVDGGRGVFDSFIKYKCLNQLNLSIMKDSILDRKQLTKQEIDTINFNSFPIYWDPVNIIEFDDLYFVTFHCL